MWYAPIGSFEYATNLHNDFLIKKFILSEQRLKQHHRLTVPYKTLLGSSFGDADRNTLKQDTVSSAVVQNQRVSAVANKTSSLEVETSPSASRANSRLNRLKGCAVDVQLKRSFKKTHLDVITYDSTVKTEK